MKIGIIFTGGTIGSRVDQSGYISAVGTAPFLLLEMYREQFGNDIDFVVEEPYCILSENLRADNLLRLASCVETMLEQQDDLEGIVITHGTDTLQYTAAFLGYVFGGAGVPVVLVSSNYVLEDSRANGFMNFCYALEFIKGGYGEGVFVSYCNPGGLPTLHRAVRLQPPTPYSDAVFSVGGSWYGRFHDGFYEQNSCYQEQEGRKSVLEFMAEGQQFALSEASGILRIIPYVGMVYPELSPEVKVVLHESFHSGTVGIGEELKRFKDQADLLEIPIYLTGLSEQENHYETVRAYESLGIRILPESAVIAQYCKLWMTLSNHWDIDSVMKTSIAGDFIFSL